MTWDRHWYLLHLHSHNVNTYLHLYDVSRRDALQGWLDTETGQAELSFDAEFTFTAGPIYKPPSLKVKTVLSTEQATGRFRSASGERFVGSKGKLVGIADVPQTGDWLLDNFLQLPTDAFALLSAELDIV